ncbi:cystathionine beta-lyase/cystathionine gamma-synthase [Saccharomonospora marina XMU15]|uniref:Cystathionine beta-lyase/cystathionine gamma-synthase n=1 Tax=Saccharomonospora marina XMU15 TaxID=882083 RepID=H5WZB9_9PSEU|nr:PLP-dependent aspartate aminotransferase family protein [Saccharomonospora marina]EHR48522.1 cystathionine beta-lyase/cystathionine gamma-synthase [Saccharomonospora marina XMU15]
MTAQWSARTRAVVAGRPTGDTEPMNVPIVAASSLGLGYSREDGTATWAALEAAIGELEGGTATAFASGIATVSAVLDLFEVPVTVAVPVDSYAGTRGVLEHGERTGRVRIVRVAPEDTGAWIAAAAEADLLWLESPTNPSLYLVDITAVANAAAAQERPPRIVVDNTFATPLGQQPLALGADIVVHSATKFIGGHSDLLLGLTVTAEETLAAGLRDARTRGGATPGALEAWLALRGLRTLAVRFTEASETAGLLARRLSEHPAVTRVRYPGSGAMLAFEVADAEAADRMCAKLRLIRHATSLGGVESTVERRAARAGDSHVPGGLLRLSVGLEDPEDLWRDLDCAL